MSTAVVIDGAYFLRRFAHSFPDLDSHNVDQVAWAIGYMAGWHLAVRDRSEPVAAGDLQAVFAVRLGRLSEDVSWVPNPDTLRRWITTGTFDPTDVDFEIKTVQKGTDMRLGLDVASMA